MRANSVLLALLLALPTVAALPTTPSSSQGDVATGTDPYGVSIDAALGQVYVGNSGNGGSLAVIDAANKTVIATIGMPCQGSGRSAVDPSNHRVFVADHDCGRVTVIDGISLTVISSVVVTGSFDPTGIALAERSHRVYVTNVYSGNVGVINGTSNTLIGFVPVSGQPHAVAVQQSTGRFFVAVRSGPLGPHVAAFDEGSSTPACTAAVGGAEDVTIDQRRGIVYAAGSQGTGVTAVRASDCGVLSTIASACAGGTCGGVAADDERGRLYVTIQRGTSVGGLVREFDTTSGTQLREFVVGFDPVGIAIDSATPRSWNTNIRSGTATWIDLECRFGPQDLGCRHIEIDLQGVSVDREVDPLATPPIGPLSGTIPEQCVESSCVGPTPFTIDEPPRNVTPRITVGAALAPTHLEIDWNAAIGSVGPATLERDVSPVAIVSVVLCPATCPAPEISAERNVTTGAEVHVKAGEVERREGVPVRA